MTMNASARTTQGRESCALKKRVLIADDHALFRDSLETLLELNGYEIVASAGNGREALEAARHTDPDLALVDISMPELDGIELTARLSQEMPELDVVILSGSDDDRDLFAALRAGARGYLVKNLESDRFLELLDAAANGERALSAELAQRVLREFSQPARVEPDQLTERESEVLSVMAGGVTSNRELARVLGVTENTVRFHVKNILDKLHLHSRAQAVGYALRTGLVSG